jgi:hypothetical protein
MKKPKRKNNLEYMRWWRWKRKNVIKNMTKELKQLKLIHDKSI